MDEGRAPHNRGRRDGNRGQQHGGGHVHIHSRVRVLLDRVYDTLRGGHGFGGREFVGIGDVDVVGRGIFFVFIHFRRLLNSGSDFRHVFFLDVIFADVAVLLIGEVR